MVLILGLAIIAGAVYAVLRKVEVRLALLLAALALGIVAGKPWGVVQKFFTTLVSPEFVVPLCSAMGFAYVLRATLCDQHLVHLLTHPLRRARFFLIPGAVLVGFIVNIPIISQTSAAVSVGPVLIPLLLAARISRVTAGSALLLGASIGGELLNQGAPEFRVVVKAAADAGLPPVTGAQCTQAVLPLVLLHLAVSTTLFWVVSARAERAHAKDRERLEQEERSDAELPPFRVSLFKAAVPLVPLLLLFLIAPPLELLRVPHGWLVGAEEPAPLLREVAKLLGQARFSAADPFDSRLIGAAMLVGVAVAALTDRGAAPRVAGAFFEGAGYAYSHIISLIVAASCFGEGVKAIGLDRPIQALIQAFPHLLVPLAVLLPLGFAFLSGSGGAAAQSTFRLFVDPAGGADMPLPSLGAVMGLGAAAGRTMSPVAAVTLMSASLTETSPADLIRRVTPPLLAGIVAVILAGMVLRGAG